MGHYPDVTALYIDNYFLGKIALNQGHKIICCDISLCCISLQSIYRIWAIDLVQICFLALEISFSINFFLSGWNIVIFNILGCSIACFQSAVINHVQIINNLLSVFFSLDLQNLTYIYRSVCFWTQNVTFFVQAS